ncbi:MAG TPA: hypothetical protein VH063_02515 [Gaiellaceae bacterium]|jgi:hypothetical protein|nr:hypothetical protein [Gaiellaceae bacterium]
MFRRIGLTALLAVLSVVLTTTAGATIRTSSGGHSSYGSSHTSYSSHSSYGGHSKHGSHSNYGSHTKHHSHKSGSYSKCGSGSSGKRCCPKSPPAGLTILKEQSASPTTGFAHTVLTVPLSRDIFYRITVTNLSNTAYTLQASDPLCDSPLGHPLNPSGPQTLPALGTFVYTCDIDALPGVGTIPADAMAGAGPYTLTNAVTVVATPVGGGDPVTLTDSVSASLN